jgi:hypothetical protein
MHAQQHHQQQQQPQAQQQQAQPQPLQMYMSSLVPNGVAGVATPLAVGAWAMQQAHLQQLQLQLHTHQQQHPQLAVQPAAPQQAQAHGAQPVVYVYAPGQKPPVAAAAPGAPAPNGFYPQPGGVATVGGAVPHQGLAAGAAL